jgi:methionine-rich copper-binding protein CopC
VGTSTWQKKNSASNQKTITGLLCNTNYQWKIRLRCGTDFTSFSSLQTFTTGACRLGEINVANDNELNIYPNPNTGQFTIDFSEINSDKITSIHVKNMLGEDVYSAQLNSPQQTINLSNSVADGVYIVEVLTSKTSITKQVIIQK